MKRNQSRQDRIRSISLPPVKHRRLDGEDRGHGDDGTAKEANGVAAGRAVKVRNARTSRHGGRVGEVGRRLAGWDGNAAGGGDAAVGGGRNAGHVLVAVAVGDGEGADGHAGDDGGLDGRRRGGGLGWLRRLLGRLGLGDVRGVVVVRDAELGGVLVLAGLLDDEEDAVAGRVGLEVGRGSPHEVALSVGEGLDDGRNGDVVAARATEELQGDRALGGGVPGDGVGLSGRHDLVETGREDGVAHGIGEVHVVWRGDRRGHGRKGGEQGDGRELHRGLVAIAVVVLLLDARSGARRSMWTLVKND